MLATTQINKSIKSFRTTGEKEISTLKILQIVSHFSDIGGGPRMIYNLSRLFQDAGYHTAIAYGSGGDNPFKGVSWPLYHIPELLMTNSGGADSALNRLVRICDGMSPDLIISHGPIDPNIVENLDTRWPTIKFVHAYHDCPAGSRLLRSKDKICSKIFGPVCMFNWYAQKCGTDKNPGKAFRAYKMTMKEIKSLRRSRVILVNSRYVRDLLVENGCKTDNIHVFPLFELMDGSDSVPCESRFSRKGKEGHDLPIVLFSGRVNYQKGLQYLLRAFRKLKNRARLLVAGDGYYLSHCRKLTSALDLEGTVEFLGWVPADQMECLYKKATVLAVPSIWPEPFGIVGLEAARHGCPVVAFDSGGISEWLGQTVEGIVVPTLDTDGFSDALLQFIDRPVARDVVSEVYTRKQKEATATAIKMISAVMLKKKAE